jgi:hypothetical protein
MSLSYQIEILDTSLNKLAEVRNPVPMAGGMVITFSKELSDFGQCKFRVSAFDDMLVQYGDIFVPHKYHVRIRRNGTIVWQGAIIENPVRNSQFIEVVAAEYLFYLSKVLVNRTSNDPATGTADGVFRIFNSGTMANAVTTIMNETIATLKTGTNSSSILSGMTLGTIDNPNYPPNMTDATGASLTGAWNFSTNLQLTFDFQTILYILKSFGVYSYADFYIDNNLVFNFKQFVGNDRHYDVNFVYNKKNSNIIDYNLPRFGQRMANDIFGIATDTNGVILHKEQSNQASITTYGLMQGTAAYSDIKDAGILNARIVAELPLVSTPDETNALVVLNETAAYPLGLWDIGDIVNLSVTNKGVKLNQTRRIVGVSVAVHDTGRETTTVQTNIPQPWQFASITA